MVMHKKIIVEHVIMTLKMIVVKTVQESLMENLTTMIAVYVMITLIMTAFKMNVELAWFEKHVRQRDFARQPAPRVTVDEDP